VNTLPRTLDAAFYLLKHRRFHEISNKIVDQLHQEWVSYGLRRDLLNIQKPFKARIPLAIRALQQDDIQHVLPVDDPNLDREERLEIASRREHLQYDIPTPYVAVDLRTDTPCFIQWLMGPEHNDKIQSFFKGRFPILGSNEMLLENAYTPVAYRSKGIMPAAMAMIAERALQLGRRYVITFVLHDNVPSLKGCTKAGFEPYMIRRDTQTLFNLFKRRQFTRIPSSFSFPHEAKRTNQDLSLELA
jgi:hypothetical protein